MMMETKAPKYILLADDDTDDCLFFEEALKEIAADTRLEKAHDGHQLMKILDTHLPPRPDIIFLDLNMPRKNGFECLEEIRQTENLRHIPVVILSTSDSSSNVKATYNLGASMYVQKPDTFIRLTNLIRKILSMDLHLGFKQPAFNNYFYSF